MKFKTFKKVSCVGKRGIKNMNELALKICLFWWLILIMKSEVGIALMLLWISQKQLYFVNPGTNDV